MSLASELAVLKTLLGNALASLVPSVGANIYVPSPEMPNGVYEGLYPYVSLMWSGYSLTAIEAFIRRTDEGKPNTYTAALVDQLVSESGSTLAATEAFNVAWVDAVNDIWNINKNQQLTDGNGVGQASGAGLNIDWQRNPNGAAEMRAGNPSIVCICTIDTLSLPYSRRNS